MSDGQHQKLSSDLYLHHTPRGGVICIFPSLRNAKSLCGLAYSNMDAALRKAASRASPPQWKEEANLLKDRGSFGSVLSSLPLDGHKELDGGRGS